MNDDPDVAAYRAEVEAWFETVAERRSTATEPRIKGKTIEEDLADLEDARKWQRRLLDAGYAGVHWPKEHGGQGLPTRFAAAVEAVRAEFAVPRSPFMVGIDMAGPTLVAHGTPEQQQEWLPGTLTGDHYWCQLFSEPDAGSDLASLKMRAVRDGDEWVVTGQKVWTTQAQISDLGMLLVRTDPDAPKHAGISFFVVDMSSPGIEVRPLRQIDGSSHFNEVFLEEVRIPHENLIGELNDGWNVARTTLGAERSAIGSGGQVRVQQLVDLAQKLGRNEEPLIRQELARLHSVESVKTWIGYRVRTATEKGRRPGREAMVLKLLNSEHSANLANLAVELQGPAAFLAPPDADTSGYWHDYFLGHWAGRIGGGTDQIQRNVIGERALGLPRDPK